MPSWVRFEHEGQVAIGTLDGETITECSGDLFGSPTPTGRLLALGDVRLLAPFRPNSVIGLWNNFHERAKKEGQTIPDVPLYFMKPVSSVVGPGEAILQPRSHKGKVIFEAELGIVIGKECKEVSVEAAADCIFGYTCVNDVTAVEVLFADKAFQQWSRCKGYDTFTPVGPCVATSLDLSEARVTAHLDGKPCQDYPLSDMIFSPHQVVSALSHIQTLVPGDLISCGTSLGVRTMKPGSTIEIRIPGVGALRNRFDTQPPSKL